MNVIEFLNKHNLKMAELNLFLQDRTVNGWGENVVDVAMSHIQTLEQENQELRKALEFYATDSYETLYTAIKILDDGGKTARRALAGDSDGSL